LPGDIAFLSHSGAICEAAIDWARGQGFGLSRLVSLGNQMDLNEADLLPPTAGDPHTHVVAMYLEGVRDGRAFIEAARRVTREKPVVAIKVGRTASGRAAVASHTGALAGDQTAYEAAFRKAGVLQATSSEAMFDWARALAWCPSPTGNRMAVLTNAGGPGAIAVDALEGECLVLAELGSETQSAMAKLLPAAASLRNPVDMLAAAGPREFADCLSLLLADEGVDAVMVILPPPPMSTAAEVVGAMIPIIQTAAKPVVFALMGEDLVAPAARLLRGARIPDYPFPERAASSLGALVRHAYQGRFAAGDPLQGEEGDREGVAGLLEQARQGADGFIESDQAAEILNAYGIELPASMIATDLQQALDCGERLGFPLALKVRSPDVAHKSDLGGVALNLQTPEALEEAYERVLANVRAAKPQAEMEGVLLQKMVPAGQEVIVGVVRDAQFGPLVMFGSGGVEVEGLDDVAFALAPLTQADIDYVLGSTWAGRRLGGYRNLPAGDRQAVVKALIQIGRLACEQEAIAEVEINPLRVLAPGQGALALDVRLRLADPSEVKHELE
jgi:acetyltransferase